MHVEERLEVRSINQHNSKTTLESGDGEEWCLMRIERKLGGLARTVCHRVGKWLILLLVTCNATKLVMESGGIVGKCINSNSF